MPVNNWGHLRHGQLQKKYTQFQIKKRENHFWTDHRNKGLNIWGYLFCTGIPRWFFHGSYIVC
jgi:hypothetical protein